MKKGLSVVLAVYNEESNLKDCLDSVANIASEIVIVDGTSTDKTVEIAKEFDAKIIIRENPPIFHINKQIALEKASYEWILQLDADERVGEQLAEEIQKIIVMNNDELKNYQLDLKSRELFLRNQEQWEIKQGKFTKDTGEIVGLFLPRLNYFLGRYLRYGGVYPDGAIRLVKNGKAFFPAKDVHEIIQLEGEVGWLESPLYHWDSPTFSRYIQRNSRYIHLIASQLNDEKVDKSIIQFLNYVIYKPIHWFLLTLIRHKGILDGWQGIVFSFFSALRFPRAYIEYLGKEYSPTSPRLRGTSH